MKLGKVIGYLCGYFLFTTILFYVLSFLDKLPKNWNYFHIMSITFAVVLIGTIIRWFLK